MISHVSAGSDERGGHPGAPDQTDGGRTAGRLGGPLRQLGDHAEVLQYITLATCVR
jgi:hypothetical protein